jgi:hypothetical protein
MDVGLQKLPCNPEYAGNNTGHSTFYAGLLHRQTRVAGGLKFFDRALCLRPNAGSLRPFVSVAPVFKSRQSRRICRFFDDG